MNEGQAHFNFEDDGIQARFEAFDRDHPEVYEKIVSLIRQLQRRGFQRYGIKSLFEQVRWHFRVERGDEEFKLNNNYHSRYARKIIREHPDLDGFFELRELKAD